MKGFMKKLLDWLGCDKLAQEQTKGHQGFLKTVKAEQETIAQRLSALEKEGELLAHRKESRHGH